MTSLKKLLKNTSSLVAPALGSIVVMSSVASHGMTAIAHAGKSHFAVGNSAAAERALSNKNLGAAFAKFHDNTKVQATIDQLSRTANLAFQDQTVRVSYTPVDNILVGNGAKLNIENAALKEKAHMILEASKDVSKNSVTQILGTITANTQLSIITPGSIFRGDGSHINVAALTIAAGKEITGVEGTKVTYTSVNQDAVYIAGGTTTVREKGMAVFFAPNMDLNNGLVVAKTQHYNAGGKGTVDLYGDGLTSFEVESNTLEQAKKLASKVNAGDGFVILTSEAALKTIRDIVNVKDQGAYNAQLVGDDIIIGGGAALTVLKADVTAKNIAVKGTKVDVREGTTLDAKTVLVGGEWFGGKADAQYLSQISASDDQKKLIAEKSGFFKEGENSAMTILDKGVVIKAADKAVIWSDGHTRTNAQIISQGGVVEISGAGWVGSLEAVMDRLQGKITADNVLLTLTSGQGFVLYDPKNILVVPTAFFNGNYWNNTGTAGAFAVVTTGGATNYAGAVTASTTTTNDVHLHADGLAQLGATGGNAGITDAIAQDWGFTNAATFLTSYVSVATNQLAKSADANTFGAPVLAADINTALGGGSNTAALWQLDFASSSTATVILDANQVSTLWGGSAMAAQNVALYASNDVVILGALTKSANAGDLTIKAGRNVYIGANIDASAVGGGNIKIYAGSTDATITTSGYGNAGQVSADRKIYMANAATITGQGGSINNNGVVSIILQSNVASNPGTIYVSKIVGAGANTGAGTGYNLISNQTGGDILSVADISLQTTKPNTSISVAAGASGSSYPKLPIILHTTGGDIGSTARALRLTDTANGNDSLVIKSGGAAYVLYNNTNDKLLTLGYALGAASGAEGALKVLFAGAGYSVANSAWATVAGTVSASGNAYLTAAGSVTTNAGNAPATKVVNSTLFGVSAVNDIILQTTSATGNISIADFGTANASYWGGSVLSSTGNVTLNSAAGLVNTATAINQYGVVRGKVVALNATTGGIGGGYDTGANAGNAIYVKADNFVGSAAATAFNVVSLGGLTQANTTLGYNNAGNGVNVAGFDANGIAVTTPVYLSQIKTTGNNLSAQIRSTEGGFVLAELASGVAAIATQPYLPYSSVFNLHGTGDALLESAVGFTSATTNAYIAGAVTGSHVYLSAITGDIGTADLPINLRFTNGAEYVNAKAAAAGKKVYLNGQSAFTLGGAVLVAAAANTGFAWNDVDNAPKLTTFDSPIVITASKLPYAANGVNIILGDRGNAGALITAGTNLAAVGGTYLSINTDGTLTSSANAANSVAQANRVYITADKAQVGVSLNGVAATRNFGANILSAAAPTVANQNTVTFYDVTAANGGQGIAYFNPNAETGVPAGITVGGVDTNNAHLSLIFGQITAAADAPENLITVNNWGGLWLSGNNTALLAGNNTLFDNTVDWTKFNLSAASYTLQANAATNAWTTEAKPLNFTPTSGYGVLVSGTQSGTGLFYNWTGDQIFGGITVPASPSLVAWSPYVADTTGSLVLLNANTSGTAVTDNAVSFNLSAGATMKFTTTAATSPATGIAGTGQVILSHTRVDPFQMNGGTAVFNAPAGIKYLANVATGDATGRLAANAASSNFVINTGAASGLDSTGSNATPLSYIKIGAVGAYTANLYGTLSDSYFSLYHGNAGASLTIAGAQLPVAGFGTVAPTYVKNLIANGTLVFNKGTANSAIAFAGNTQGSISALSSTGRVEIATSALTVTGGIADLTKPNVQANVLLINSDGAIGAAANADLRFQIVGKNGYVSYNAGGAVYLTSATAFTLGHTQVADEVDPIVLSVAVLNPTSTGALTVNSVLGNVTLDGDWSLGANSGVTATTGTITLLPGFSSLAQILTLTSNDATAGGIAIKGPLTGTTSALNLSAIGTGVTFAQNVTTTGGLTIAQKNDFILARVLSVGGDTSITSTDGDVTINDVGKLIFTAAGTLNLTSSTGSVDAIVAQGINAITNLVLSSATGVNANFTGTGAVTANAAANAIYVSGAGNSTVTTAGGLTLGSNAGVVNVVNGALSLTTGANSALTFGAASTMTVPQGSISLLANSYGYTSNLAANALSGKSVSLGFSGANAVFALNTAQLAAALGANVATLNIGALSADGKTVAQPVALTGAFDTSGKTSLLALNIYATSINNGVGATLTTVAPNAVVNLQTTDDVNMNLTAGTGAAANAATLSAIVGGKLVTTLIGQITAGITASGTGASSVTLGGAATDILTLSAALNAPKASGLTLDLGANGGAYGVFTSNGKKIISPALILANANGSYATQTNTLHIASGRSPTLVNTPLVATGATATPLILNAASSVTGALSLTQTGDLQFQNAGSLTSTAALKLIVTGDVSIDSSSSAAQHIVAAANNFTFGGNFVPGTAPITQILLTNVGRFTADASLKNIVLNNGANALAVQASTVTPASGTVAKASFKTTGALSLAGKQIGYDKLLFDSPAVDGSLLRDLNYGPLGTLGITTADIALTGGNQVAFNAAPVQALPTHIAKNLVLGGITSFAIDGGAAATTGASTYKLEGLTINGKIDINAATKFDVTTFGVKDETDFGADRKTTYNLVGTKFLGDSSSKNGLIFTTTAADLSGVANASVVAPTVSLSAVDSIGKLHPLGIGSDSVSTKVTFAKGSLASVILKGSSIVDKLGAIKTLTVAGNFRGLSTPKDVAVTLNADVISLDNPLILGALTIASIKNRASDVTIKDFNGTKLSVHVSGARPTTLTVKDGVKAQLVSFTNAGKGANSALTIKGFEYVPGSMGLNLGVLNKDLSDPFALKYASDLLFEGGSLASDMSGALDIFFYLKHTSPDGEALDKFVKSVMSAQDRAVTYPMALSMIKEALDMINAATTDQARASFGKAFIVDTKVDEGTAKLDKNLWKRLIKQSIPMLKSVSTKGPKATPVAAGKGKKTAPVA